jgi:uncharacterized protein (TIGR02145 family)
LNMSLITRQGKGEKLTIQEMDGNLEYLEGLSQAAELGVAWLAADLQAAVPHKTYRARLTAGEIDWPGYGYLYNWYAVDDARGLANPEGGTGLVAPNEWRVPSNTDWSTLATFAGGSGVAGGKLKSKLKSIGAPFYGWFGTFGEGSTDDYNFSGLPAGIRRFDGIFNGGLGFNCLWWSTSGSFLPTEAYYWALDNTSVLNDNYVNKEIGASVRLVREATAGELLLNDGDTSDISSLDSYTGNDGTVYVTVAPGP